ncbi:MAG: Uma2 family endonuclease [Gemmataceae bacterium]
MPGILPTEVAEPVRPSIALNEVEVPKGYELIDGALVEMPSMGVESSVVLGRLFVSLHQYCENTRCGIAIAGEAGYRCFPHKRSQVRKPDVSVILGDPDTISIPTGDFERVPDLVVEVVSPNEAHENLSQKIRDFRKAGTRLMWIIEPGLRSVTIERADGTITRLEEPAELTGESVLPGFSVALSAFLPRVIPA